MQDEEVTENYNFVDPSNPAEEMATGSQLIKALNLEVAHKVWYGAFPNIIVL